MSASPHDSSSSPNRNPENARLAPSGDFESGPRRSPGLADPSQSVTSQGLLSLLYQMPAQWVRAYVSDFKDGSPWEGGDREFLCGPFIADMHPPDA